MWSESWIEIRQRRTLRTLSPLFVTRSDSTFEPPKRLLDRESRDERGSEMNRGGRINSLGAEYPLSPAAMADAVPRTHKGYPLRVVCACVLAREFLADTLSRGPCVRAKKGTGPGERGASVVMATTVSRSRPALFAGPFLPDGPRGAAREFRPLRSSERSTPREIRIL